MAPAPHFDLTKPEPTVIRLINKRHTNPIIIEQGDETTLTQEGKRIGALLKQVKLGRLGWGWSRELIEFLGAIVQGEEEQAAKEAPPVVVLVKPKKKRTRKQHPDLKTALSPAGNRSFNAKELMKLIPRGEKWIRDRARHMAGVLHSLNKEKLHKQKRDCMVIPEAVAYLLYQMCLTENLED
jgi:hypothetical protein